MNFGDTAKLLGWELRNIETGWDVGPASFDSRRTYPGDLFFGLTGEINGGKFAESALNKGARAAVVSREWAGKIPAGKPVIPVDDPLQALADLGKLQRQNFSGKVLGITGSCGKTTAKDTISHVLSQKYRVLKSPASYNNHIGVPYTLSQLSPEYDIAVIEMGANHPGEIAGLCEIAQPTAGMITMVGRAHMEGFGDLRGVAEAKGELFRGLTISKTAFVNFDDPYVTGQSAGLQIRIGYGFSFPAAGQGFARIYQGIKQKNSFSVLNERFVFPFPDFMQIHALAAVTIGHFWNVETYKIRDAMKTFPGVKGRMRKFEHEGITLYDDTYNSNPSSLGAAMKFIAGQPGGRKIAVLGDMMELDDFSREEHERALNKARDLGFYRVFTYGEAFAQAGSDEPYDSHEKLAAALLRTAQRGDMVLFKGSRLTEMEKVLNHFVPESERG